MFGKNEKELENENLNTSNNPFEAKEEELKEETEAVQEETQETEQTDIEEKEDETAKLKAQIEDINNKYLRLAADFDNYRKRQAQERESLLKYGASEVLTKILVVLDTFERAKESLKDVDNCDSVKESYEVAFKQLMDVLSKAGLEKIEATGQQFDPNLHEAIAQTPTNEHPDNTIVSTMQTGYKLQDRVLRPALVNVAVNEG